MAWPKGMPRKKVTSESSAPFASDEEAARAVVAVKAQPKKRWTMKARPDGWDAADMPAEESTDRFYIAKEDFPEGYDLQWVTDTVMGMVMPQERRKFENRRWTPVDQTDFGGIFNGRWMPKDAPGEINQDGMVLMARPIEDSIRAREVDKRRAEEQVRIKEQAWKGGDINATGAREPVAVRTNRIVRSYERIDVPEDK